VIINNSTAGLFTINATSVWHFADSDPGANPASQNVTRSTSGNSGPGGTGPATKQFVDAFITINPPEATNSVGQAHTVTVLVMENEGLGAGFQPAANLPVTVTLQNDATSQWAYTGAGDLCASPNGTNGSGQCTVTFTSPTAGTVTINASVSFVLDGVPLTRSTNGQGQNSGPAIKHFVAGTIRWLKVDNAGRPLGGATFQLCRTNDYVFDGVNGISSTPLNPPQCITVTDNGQNDEDPTVGAFLVSGEPLGRYTIQETQAPPGYVIQTNTQTVDLVPGSVNGSAANPFVNGRPILKISGFGYTNVAAPGISQPDGIFAGTTTYTVNLHNYGTAASNLINSSLVVSGNANCGLGGNTLVLDGMSIPAGGDSGPITMTCTYDHPSPTAITATLTVNDLTNGLQRAASGSPATITFTVNPG
jgi:hypothetical protein